MTRALIVVDPQVDFVEGGSLAVTGGRKVVADIASFLQEHPPYETVVVSEDYHSDPGTHWSPDPDFSESWPVHCAIGTPGAQLCEPLKEDMFDAVFRKGRTTAAYSAFEGVTIWDDGELKHSARLDRWLETHNVHHVDVCGIATDYCVRATVLDARRLGLHVRVFTDLCAAVAPDTTGREALSEMINAGATIAFSKFAIDMP